MATEFDPQDQSPETPQAPQPVRVVIDGKEYFISPDAAEVFRQREEVYNRGFQDQTRRLREMEQQVQALAQRTQPPAQPQSSPAQGGLDYNTRIWEDPTGVLLDFGQRLLNYSEQKRLAERQQEQQERALADYWSRFYADHSDLKRDKKLVSAIVQDHLNTILTINDETEQQQKIAELTRTYIVQLANRVRSSESGTSLPDSSRAFAEGGGGTTPRAPREQAPPAPTGATGALQRYWENEKKRKGG